MADSLEYILACQICLEDFEESGDHVPRILPCSHSLCEKCLKQLIQGKFVCCPECRNKHRAGNKERTFPQNKYILTNIRRKKEEDEQAKAMKICDDHGKELSLYCKKCLTSIRQRCLSRFHRGHDVMELEDAEREKLLERIETAVDYLRERKDNISEANIAGEQHDEKVFHILTATARKKITELLTQIFDKLQLNMSRQCLLHQGGHALKFIDVHLGILNNIKEKMKTEIVTSEEIKANMQTVASIEKKLGDQYFVLKYKFSELQPSNDVEKLCGYLKMYALPGFIIQTKGTGSNQGPKCSGSVTISVNTRCGDAEVYPAEGTCFAVCGNQRLAKFNGITGEKVLDIDMRDANGLMEALGQNRIEVRYVKDLSTKSLEPLFVPDKTVNDYFTATGGQVVVVACGISGLKTYDIKTKQLEWSVSGKINGLENALDVSKITTDENGSIFVCDRGNSCVLVFSFRGEYVSTLVRKGDQGVGEPVRVLWSKALSSLIVTHRKDDGKMWVSVVKRRS